MFGTTKNQNTDSVIDEKESAKIRDRLGSDETIVMSVRQSRVKPGGAAILTPNTVFITEKRVIIRNPIRLGLGEHIEEYHYHQITNVRLEKGLFSSSLVFAIPGMTEMSKGDRKLVLWGRDSEGTIDAIPKDSAEKIYGYVREKIQENKKRRENADTSKEGLEDPLQALKMRFVKGEITKGEYEEMRQVLE